NTIRDTRSATDRKQSTGVRIEENAGPVRFDGNTIEAPQPVDDRRKASPPAAPLKEKSTISLGDRTITLTKLDSLPFVESEYTKRFNFDSAANPKLKELRERYHLNEVVQPGKDEFDRQLLLLHWTHAQFKKFGRPSTNAKGALEILDAIDKGHTFFCAQYAEVLVSAAASLGWIDRPLALRRHQGGNKNGGSTEHSVTEIWSNQHRKWIVLDPTSDLYVEKNGIPLNAYEIRQEWFYHDGKDLAFVIGPERKRYKKSELPVLIQHIPGFGDLTFDPDEPDKYGFIGYIPNTNLMDAGYDYGKMFIIKDKLCDGTNWHVRPNPAQPATDPYFPLNQASLSLTPSTDGQIEVSLQTLTPNFDHFEIQIDEKGWQPSRARFLLPVHPGANHLEVRSCNTSHVSGPVSAVELTVSN
ncbi:MAG TPA: hypothetical protein VHM91_14975, partial [Verrucomicrobiales bacterium]|nr:hypothetical protein [Verrucomicrobiales bacterium]